MTAKLGHPAHVFWFLSHVYLRKCSIYCLLPVGGENYSSSLFGDTEDAVPKKPLGFWVHTSGGLILKAMKEIKAKVRNTNTF